MKPRILLVEDEEHLQEAIKLNLEMEGYEVNAVNDGKKAIKAFKQERFSMVILDIMLPEMDGLQVCETIRLEDSEVPILFLTARNSSQDRIEGLKKGGDDYLAKPFNLEEMLLRVQGLIRRSRRAEKSIDQVKIGEKTIDFNTFEIASSQKEEKIILTKKEAMLLKLLVERKNEVVSREKILEVVWGYDVYPSTRTIDNFILSFRKYFEQDPKQPKHFHSIRGVGYKFVP